MVFGIWLISSLFLNAGCVSNNTQNERDASQSEDGIEYSMKLSSEDINGGETTINENKNIQELSSDENEGKNGTSERRQSNELIKYANISRLGKEAQNTLLNKGFVRYHLLTSSTIDRNQDDKFDSESVSDHLLRVFPDENGEGLLIVNWEKRAYLDLKKSASTKDFKIAEQEFVNLIRFIKSQRPKITVGIYGLPFRIFTNRYPQYGKKGKLSKILKECDVICPSLYARFSDDEIGAAKTDLYVKNNIEIAIEYSKQLRKPILPFVWEIIHIKEDRRLVPLSQFERKMNIIATYFNSSKSSPDIGVKGLIWWTPSKPEQYYKTVSMPNNDMKYMALEKTSSSENGIRDSILQEYMEKAFPF